ncbi:DDE-type integrase/transposase/recombinase [Ixodes scapularis]
MTRTLNAYAGSSEELLKDLAKKYLPTGGVYSSPSYDGTPNQELDKDIQLYELREAIADSVLYKENFGNNNTPWLLVIPSDLREIFQACHDDPTSGHLGYSRTLARIREKYYWPKLPKTVHLYTRSCHECQRRKKPPTRPAGLLQPISPPTAPFQQIGMDLLGPFPPSTSGNRWIIVATDYLTRYAETKALPSGTAVEVAKFFIESIVLRHGAPEVLITDRGSSFMAQLTQEILRLSHTSHRRTTAYHPQTNGLTERLNKTIADMISMYVDVEHKTWDEVLPYVTFAYNTAVQETTGFTPFQLVHGRKVTTMLDAMLPHEPSDNESDDAQAVAQRAEEVRQLARLLIQDQQRVDAGRYNLRRRDVHFQPGDRVWVWTPIRRRGLSEKLLKRYFGPYKVLRRLGELNYEVMPDGTRTSSRRPPRPEVVHVVRLKPYYAR